MAEPELPTTPELQAWQEQQNPYAQQMACGTDVYDGVQLICLMLMCTDNDAQGGVPFLY